MNIFPFWKEKNIRFTERFDTSKLSYIRAGGIASAMLYPSCADELADTVREAQERGIPYKIIGGCSNTYFSDEDFCGVIISTRLLNSFCVTEDFIELGAGSHLSLSIKNAFEQGVGFLPSLFGIPGTVGGALRNNAGALGREISDSFIEGVFYSVAEDRVLKLKKDELSFTYRSSDIGSEKLIFLSGAFAFDESPLSDCHTQMNTALEYRKKRHPNFPSLGSFFKRSGSVIPAELIEKAGLKGKRIGDAAISELHSGFIVNLGKATSHEITLLAEETEKIVYEKFGVTLQREAELVK